MPESVLFDPETECLYVSNINGGPGQKNGEGFLSKVDLNGEILDGHLSSSLCHLGNIACRLKRTLQFNPNAEKFIDDDEADSYLTKMYRAPYLLPEKV